MRNNSLKNAIWQLKIYVLGHFFPKKLVEYRFRSIYKRNIDWKHPQTIDEKINWAKFNTDTSEWTRLADKYEVRKYVRQRGLEDALVPLYGKWKSVEDINWESLPSQFVMKMNNGSGDVMICTDKKHFDVEQCKRHFLKLLKGKFGFEMGEPHYNKIKPLVIAEALLDKHCQSLPSTSLVDYKFFCFDGKPAYVLVCLNRVGHDLELAVYDLEWNFHPEYSVSSEHCVLHNEPLPRPLAFAEMTGMAARLSEGFPFVRVDLYEVGGKPYFGEMTFTPAAGFMYYFTSEFNRILGDKYILKHQ